MSAATSTMSICAELADRLANSLGPRRYAMWFDRSARFDYDDQHRRVSVAVPNQFVADWIKRHFHQHLEDVANQTFGQDVDCAITVEPHRFPRQADQADPPHAGMYGDKGPPPAGTHAASRGRKEAAPAPISASNTAPAPHAVRRSRKTNAADSRHRLEQFVVGPSNQLAYAAATQFVEDDHAAGQTRLLFVHGGCGLGKTHLLQGICARARERHPAARIQDTTGEQFTNDFLAAVRSGRIDAFRRGIRNLDLLAVDDVHFIADKQATQQEFHHSLDAIAMSGARVVLASDCHPRHLTLFSEALISRCICGMIAQVNDPDPDTRGRIITVMAKRRGMVLLEPALQILGQRCRGSVREIEGSLTKLHALATLTRPRGQAKSTTPHGQFARAHGNTIVIGRALVDQLYHDHNAIRPRRPVRFATILDTVAAELKVDAAAVRGPSRRRHIVLARALTIHLARTLTSMSYPEIARALDRPNHSTIITAAKRIAGQIEDPNQLHLVPGTLEPVPVADLATQLRDKVINAT